MPRGSKLLTSRIKIISICTLWTTLQQSCLTISIFYVKKNTLLAIRFVYQAAEAKRWLLSRAIGFPDEWYLSDRIMELWMAPLRYPKWLLDTVIHPATLSHPLSYLAGWVEIYTVEKVLKQNLGRSGRI